MSVTFAHFMQAVMAVDITFYGKTTLYTQLRTQLYLCGVSIIYATRTGQRNGIKYEEREEYEKVAMG